MRTKYIGRQIPLVIENECNSPKANLLEKKIKSNKLIQHVDRPQGMNNDQIFEVRQGAGALLRFPKDLKKEQTGGNLF